MLGGLLGAIGAIIGSALGSAGLSTLCMFASGGLAFTLYRRGAAQTPIRAGKGAQVGALAGLLGAALMAFFGLLPLLSQAGRGEARRALLAKAQEMSAASADPAAQKVMEQLTAYISTDQGLIALSVLAVLMTAALFVGFSSLGGMIGAAMFGQEKPKREL
jgi:hypothetical protein